MVRFRYNGNACRIGRLAGHLLTSILQVSISAFVLCLLLTRIRRSKHLI